MPTRMIILLSATLGIIVFVIICIIITVLVTGKIFADRHERELKKRFFHKVEKKKETED